jgi:hypothetical protein
MANNVDRPDGSKIIGTLLGSPWQGAVRKFTLTAAAAQGAIYKRQIVEYKGAGWVGPLAAGTSTANAAGVVIGVEVNRAVAQTEHPGYLPASTAGSILVCLHPYVLMEMQEDGVGDNLELINRNMNTDIVSYASGSTTTGLCIAELDSDAEVTTAATPLRILDLVNREDNVQGDSTEANGNNARWVVRFNQHSAKTGLAGTAAS